MHSSKTAKPAREVSAEPVSGFGSLRGSRQSNPNITSTPTKQAPDAAAVLLKGYERAGIMDNWQKFLRNGQFDMAAAMTEILGLKFEYVKARPEASSDDPEGSP